MLCPIMRGQEFVQDGGQLVQAVQVRPGELLQDRLAVGGQADPHHPALAWSSLQR
jgi:hypothetical protein